MTENLWTFAVITAAMTFIALFCYLMRKKKFNLIKFMFILLVVVLLVLVFTLTPTMRQQKTFGIQEKNPEDENNLEIDPETEINVTFICDNSSTLSPDQVSMAWLYERPIEGRIVENIATLAKQNQNKKLHIFCGSSQCMASVNKLNNARVTAEFAVLSSIVKGTPLEQWLARHPFNKLLLGKAYETYLQEVTILGILWNYGGLYISPLVRLGSKINEFERNETFVSREESRPNNELSSVLDFAYFPKCDPFVRELIVEYAKVYYQKDTKFNFHKTVWASAKEICKRKLSCPSEMQINMTHTSISDVPIVNYYSYSKSSNKMDILEGLAALHYLPLVDLKSKESSGYKNITTFYSNRGKSTSSIMLSVQVEKKEQSSNTAYYFSERSPIGCRDSKMLDFMRHRNVSAFLSGPLILALNNAKQSNRVKVLSTVSENVLEMLPANVQSELSHVTIDRMTSFKQVLELKERYQSAKLVITQNIRHALLCAALETPVIFILEKSNNTSPMLEEFTTLFHTLDLRNVTDKEAFKKFSWEEIPHNPNLGELMRYKATLWDVIRQNKPLYDSARRYGMIPMSPLASKYPEDSTIFHLIFTTSKNSTISLFGSKHKQEGYFNWRHMRTVESIFYNHPTSKILVHSNMLSQDKFDVFTEMGYSITVQRYDLVQLLKDSPAKDFVERLARVKNGGYWYSHVTDLIRLLVLYKYGGVYMDTDMILVRSLHTLKPNCLGYQDERDSSLNGAILKFTKNHPFIEACLVRFAHHYTGSDWARNGPELLTLMYNQWKKTHTDVYAYGHKYFYMMQWSYVKKQAFNLTSGAVFEKKMKILKSEAYSVHLNSKITGYIGLRGEKVKKGTIGSYILNSFCVLCDRMY